MVLVEGLMAALSSVATFGVATPFMDELGRRLRLPNLPTYWSVTGLAAALALTLFLMPQVAEPVTLAGVFVVDALGLFFMAIFLAVSLMVAVSSIGHMRGEPNLGVFYSLLLLSTLGMMLISLSVDILTLYIAWELMSIPSYVLVGIRKYDAASNEGSIKYFVVSALSSALIVYGLSLTYGLTGSTSIYKASEVLPGLVGEYQPLAMLATVLFIAGFGMKVAAVPFHMWLPDAYEGAPTPIAAFLSGGSKSGGFVAMLRVFLLALFALRLSWAQAFAFIALVTMTLGNVIALMQRNFVRLLAYSSIAHTGYILIGLAALNIYGLVGALYHILSHAFMKTAAFIAAAAVQRGAGVTDLEGYKGLGRRMPLTSITLSIALLGLAGIPPLNGFVSKLILFTAALEGGLAWLALAGIINSAFSLAYYGWVMKRMFFDEGPSQARVEEPLSFAAPLAAGAAMTVATGILVEPIYAYLRLAASFLLVKLD